jgi:hypothetical protein
MRIDHIDAPDRPYQCTFAHERAKENIDAAWRRHEKMPI